MGKSKILKSALSTADTCEPQALSQARTQISLEISFTQVLSGQRPVLCAADQWPLLPRVGCETKATLPPSSSLL